MIKIKLIPFNLIFSAVTLLAYNRIFFSRLSETATPLQLAGIAFCLWGALFAAACLLFWRRTAKPLAVFLLCANAVSLYFMNTYHISIDKIMLLNVLETDPAEAMDLINLRLAAYILVGAVLPAILIVKTNIIFPPAKTRLMAVAAAAVVFLAVIIPNGKTAANFLRNHKKLKYDLIPVNYIGAVISAHKILSLQNHELVPVGTDAAFSPYWHNGKDSLIVIVIGETARAANFSLGGYQRPTNAPLSPFADGLYYYANASSCGTATAVSLPCIFSKDPRHGFDPRKASYTENVLDIAQRAGYNVLWRENNSGCKGACARIKTEEFCQNYACNDLILLKDFAKSVQSALGSHIVVLHQQGSHGPAYYKRFPAKFARFAPYCQTGDLAQCSTEEIVNAYDNSLLFTSHMLAETIKELKTLENAYNVAMIYVSDHGESLGENGLYLHSAPYALAPQEQTHVPLLLWLPQESAKALNINTEALRQALAAPVSQDNIFHTVLGLAGIKTAVYNPALDLLAPMRR